MNKVSVRSKSASRLQYSHLNYACCCLSKDEDMPLKADLQALHSYTQCVRDAEGTSQYNRSAVHFCSPSCLCGTQAAFLLIPLTSGLQQYVLWWTECEMSPEAPVVGPLVPC